MDIEKIIRGYLPQVVHLSLATAKDNAPWVTEVHFAYDDDLNLYFRSLTSRRHSQEIAINPKVAGNIIKQHALGDTAEGVYFEGTAEKLGPGDDQMKAFRCLNARLKSGDGILEEAKNPDGHQFYKITVQSWYIFGKFGADSAQKHELAWNGAKK